MWLWKVFRRVKLLYVVILWYISHVCENKDYRTRVNSNVNFEWKLSIKESSSIIINVSHLS